MKQAIQFGVGQMATETPAKIKAIYRTLMFLSLMWVMAIEPRFPQISEHVKYIIDSSLSIANYGIYFFCNCFGYAPPEQVKQDVAVPALPEHAEILPTH